MKLIVAGATGYVGSEVIRQALCHPGINSIVALARRPTPVPEKLGPGADVSKLKSAVCEDFENYSDSIRQELAGADACIWVLAVTPTKSKAFPFEQVRKTCVDYTFAGLDAIVPNSNNPFRFIYTSGALTIRDPAKKPLIMGDYSLMRGQLEERLLDYPQQSKNPSMEICVTKPGLIVTPGYTNLTKSVFSTVGRNLIGLTKMNLDEAAASLLDQAVNGIEKNTLLNADMIRIGQRVLDEQPGLRTPNGTPS